MSRIAVFEKGNIDLKIIVSCGESRDLDKFPVGHISWRSHSSRTPGYGLLDVNVGVDYRELYQSPEERAPRPWTLVAVALSADTSKVFLGRQMDRVEIWDRETARNVRTIEGSFSPIRDLFPAANSTRFVIDTETRMIVVDSATGEFAGSFPPSHPIDDHRVAISADGDLLVNAAHASLSGMGGFDLANVNRLGSGETSTLVVPGPAIQATAQSVYKQKAKSISLAPDGCHVVFVLEGFGTPIQCWDLEAESIVWTKEFFGEDGNDLHVLLFTPRSQRLCVYRKSRFACAPEIWSVTSGKIEAALEVPPEQMWRASQQAVRGSRALPIMTVSGDESLLAVGFNNGRVLVWHLPSGRLAGLVYNTDWELEGSLANDEGQLWVDPPPSRSRSPDIIVGHKPYRGKKLAAIGFDASNRLIGISLHPSVAWVWKADPKWLRADDGD
ncbi:MAG: WD40 repeat domain-containing protein [Verrucomicrobiales bacterium]